MLKTIITHVKERKIIRKNELKQQVYKSLKYLLVLKNYMAVRYLTRRQIQFRSYSSSSRTRSICLASGRTRSIYRHFRLSRHMIRYFGSMGMLAGLSKSSW